MTDGWTGLESDVKLENEKAENIGCIRSMCRSKILVTKDKHASDVARVMINSGQQKEPFYIFDVDAVYNQVHKFKEKLPRVQIFYAIKANDDSMMVKVAIALGLGFDCASPGEINKVRAHNVRPTSIIYAAPVKSPEQMIFARQSGVRHTTFESSCELNRLKQYWPDARLLIRIKIESDSVYKLGDKYGCEFTEALSLLDEAAQIDMTVIGVAFHVGSACFSKMSYTDGLRLARDLFDYEVRKGRRMTILDIGGGFFDDGTDRFDEVARILNDGLTEWFSEPEIQIIAEPGRFICEPAFTLYSNIRKIRTVINFDIPVKMVYLNDGLNGTLFSVETWHTINKLKKTSDIEDTEDLPQDTIIWGPTLHDNDVLGSKKLVSCSEEDWLFLYPMGAYSLSFKTKFCSMEKTFVRSVISNELWSSLKNNPVFSSDTFVMDSDLPACLPSTLPPLIPDTGKYSHRLFTLE